MDYFSLPSSTIVQRVVAKNSFDSYTTNKQKELFAKDIVKIIWSNSLSSETLNLPGRNIQEIQIFTIELKEQKEIKSVLDIIDKAIPYHIVFVVEFGDSAYLSTSAKHPSPLDESKSVIDWTFKSRWFTKVDNPYRFELKKSLDNIFYYICNQLSIRPDNGKKSLSELISYNSKLYALSKEIESINKKISSCGQFNKKVALNLRVKELEQEMTNVLNT